MKSMPMVGYERAKHGSGRRRIYVDLRIEIIVHKTVDY